MAYNKRGQTSHHYKRSIFCFTCSFVCLWRARNARYIKGARLSLLKLWPAIIANDISLLFGGQYIPLYLFQGKHDRQAFPAQAQQYGKNLIAPVMNFYTFGDVARFPHLESHRHFLKIIIADITGDFGKFYWT
ncbi:hypothetical protein [Pedobacter sp. L105]|uniref:hypothetical protein n=1 Tax=Pedobacter sp. L105 TaxID=1641871 RepID=UPI00131E4C30|nr:hypothetical protein [Pedobacter sp. L105]